MKRFLADIFLTIAFKLGARRVTVNVIRDAYTQAAADAVLTAQPAWGDDEAGAVSRFLKSPGGQLFSRRMRAVAAHVAIEGANDRGNTVHAAGVSAGWNECVRYLHSLSRVSGDQDTAAAGLAGGNDRPATEDESQLLERLSP